jgi:hypothetical protein
MTMASQNPPRLPRGQKLVLALVVLLESHPVLPGTLVWAGSISIQKKRLRLSSFHGTMVWEQPMVTMVICDEIHFPALLVVVVVQADSHPWREITTTVIWSNRHINHHHHRH